MTSPELQRLLKRLHEELGHARSLDDESRELLAVVSRDIATLTAAVDDAAGHVPAVRFESEHPALSAVARQLVDALGKAGI